MNGDVQKVFDYWIERHTSGKGRKPVLSSERVKKIERAIKDHGVETTLRAIDGCLLSDWHMGENPSGQKYNDISLILRNASNIEKFAGLVDGEIPNVFPRDVQLLSNCSTINVPLLSNSESESFTESGWIIGLVDRAFATWNIDPSKSRRKLAVEAWSVLLHDLDPTACNEALTYLAVTKDWMPRPADIRRRVLADRLTAPAPPEAWVQYQAAVRAVSNGTAPSGVHECVAVTVRRLGVGLHTNGDRDLFVQVYGDVVADFEAGVLLP